MWRQPVALAAPQTAIAPCWTAAVNAIGATSSMKNASVRAKRPRE
jgi:hypothetical protein